MPFGDRKGKGQGSSNSGVSPHWGSAGKELYYVELGNRAFSIVAVPVKEQGDRLQFGSPQTLIGNMNAATFPVYAVSPGGKGILLSRFSQQGNQSFTLVTNFAEGPKK